MIMTICKHNQLSIATISIPRKSLNNIGRQRPPVSWARRADVSGRARRVNAPLFFYFLPVWGKRPWRQDGPDEGTQTAQAAATNGQTDRDSMPTSECRICWRIKWRVKGARPNFSSLGIGESWMGFARRDGLLILQQFRSCDHIIPTRLSSQGLFLSSCTHLCARGQMTGMGSLSQF